MLREVQPAQFPVPDDVRARLYAIIEKYTRTFDRTAADAVFASRGTLYVIPLDVPQDDAARVQAEIDAALRDAGVPAQTGTSRRFGRWNGIYVAYENF